VVARFAGIEGVYYCRSDTMVKEYIKVDPTKHSEELLAALPSLQQMK
jgi:hypothetical protein